MAGMEKYGCSPPIEVTGSLPSTSSQGKGFAETRQGDVWHGPDVPQVRGGGGGVHGGEGGGVVGGAGATTPHPRAQALQPGGSDQLVATKVDNIFVKLVCWLKWMQILL